MADAPPPNWYPDPDDPSQQRWWDGQRWAHHRRPTVTAPPGPAPTAGPQSPTAPPDPPPPHQSEPLPPPPPPPGLPYATDSTPYRGPGGTELADLGKRLGATVLDAVFGSIIWWALYLPVALLAALLGTASEALAFILSLIGLVAGIFGMVFYYYMAEGRTGQTYGKHLLGIATVRTDSGHPIGSGAAFGRGIVKGVGLWVLGLGWLWATWDDRRQGWHDKAVSSVVVAAPQSTGMNPVDFIKHVWNTTA